MKTKMQTKIKKQITKIKPKNDWAKVLFILNDSDKVSMADVLTKYDSTFYKFQARLSELEREHICNLFFGYGLLFRNLKLLDD